MAANTFTIANGTGAVTFNPAQITNPESERIYSALFEGLVTINSETNQPEPGIAAAWHFSADNRTLTLALRKTSWTDDTPITAETVKKSWLYLLQNSSNHKKFLMTELVKGAYPFSINQCDESEVGIEVVNDSTIKLHFNSPRPDALNCLATSAFAVLPMHVVDAAGQAWADADVLVCNGPFKLLSKDSSGTVSLTENRKYWNHGNLALARLVFLPAGASSAVYQDFKDGKIAWIAQVPENSYGLVASDGKLQKIMQPVVQYCYINNNHGTLNDVNVRKALSLAIDRQFLVENVLDGNAIAANSIVPLEQWQDDREVFNVEKAKELLSKAGFTDGKNFPELTLVTNTDDLRHLSVMNYLARCWKENLGISIKIEDADWTHFYAKRLRNGYELCRGGWHGFANDGATFLEQLISTDSENAGKYNNPKFDSIMRQAALSGGNQRLALLKQAESLAIDEDCALIPLYYESELQLFDSDTWEGFNAQNVASNGMLNYMNIHLKNISPDKIMAK